MMRQGDSSERPPEAASEAAAPVAAAPDPGPVTEHLPRARLMLLFAVGTVSVSGNTAMQSVLPSIGSALKVTDVWLTMSFTWSALLWTLCAPYWARRSDRRGRKTMMLLGMASFVASFALCALAMLAGLRGLISGAAALLCFAIARGVWGGFGCATPPAIQAYVASRTSRGERTQALALIASSQGLGTVVGPVLAPLLILPVVGLVGPFIAFSAIGLVTLIAVQRLLPHDRPAFAAQGCIVSAPSAATGGEPIAAETADGADAPESLPAGAGVRLRWLDPRLRPWLVAGVFGGAAQAVFASIAGFLVLDRLGLRGDPTAGAGPVGLVMMCGAFAMLLAQWGLIPMFRLSPTQSVRWGMIMTMSGVALWALPGGLHVIAVGYTIATLGFGLFRPGQMAGASLAVNRQEQGQVAGMIASMFGAVYFLAPPGVWLYNHAPGLCYLAIEALCLVGVVYSFVKPRAAAA